LGEDATLAILPAGSWTRHSPDAVERGAVKELRQRATGTAKSPHSSERDLGLSEQEGLVVEVLVTDGVTPFHHLVQEFAPTLVSTV
jgi:hypothetical protein